MFSHKIGEGESVVSEIVRASIQRGIFDREIFEKYGILTSRGIQKRYFEIVKRRKNLEINGDILLVDADLFSDDARIKRENVNISSENADIFTQSKVKESKVNSSSTSNNAREDAGLGDVMAEYFDKINPEPSPSCIDALKDYTERLSAPVVLHALNIARDERKVSWSYIRGILQSYSRNGLNTLDAVLSAERSYRAGRESTGSRTRGNGKKSLTFYDVAERSKQK